MNIFALDLNAQAAAQYHCDKHVVKMMTEYVQILSTVIRLKLGKPGVMTYYKSKKKEWVTEEYKYTLEEELNKKQQLYLATHVNHPCVLWAAESDQNFNWLRNLAYWTSIEYKNRYEKKHKAYAVLSKIGHYYLQFKFDKFELTDFPQAMPEEYHDPDPVIAYRNFYNYDKSRFAKWKNGQIPSWFINKNEQNETVN